MLDVVSVFCPRDLGMQLLQARSLGRLFERSGLGRVLYVWNDLTSPPEGLDDKLRGELAGVPFQLFRASDLGVAGDAVAWDSWTTQQALKLAAAAHVSTPSYLVLDAKNHVVRPTSWRDFIDPDGRAVAPPLDTKSRPDFEYCQRYLGVPDGATPGQPMVNVTPFVLHTQLVTDLVDTLEGEEGSPLSSVFLRHQHKLTEFGIYDAYCVSRGLAHQDLYRLDRPRCETLWWETVRTATAFDEAMDRIGHGEACLMGIHWLAALNLTPRQRQRICRLWVDRGLMSAAEEGERLIDSTIAGMSARDWAFAQTFQADRS